MVATNRIPPTPPVVLHFRGSGEVTMNGSPLTQFHHATNGAGSIPVDKLAQWFGMKPQDIRRFQTDGIRTAAGEVIRLDARGLRNHVYLSAISRFLRQLAECGPLASGGRKPEPYGVYAIRNRSGIPVIVNGTPLYPMSEASYAQLIGEPQPDASSNHQHQ